MCFIPTDTSAGPVSEGKAAQGIKNLGHDVAKDAKAATSAIKSTAKSAVEGVKKGTVSLGNLLKTDACEAVGVKGCDVWPRG